MYTYYLRCAETDKELLYALAEKLGVLAKTYTPVNCTWDEVGHLTEPTGEVVDDTPVMAVKTNKAGEPYWHINLMLPKPLGELANDVYAATGDESLGAALADMGRFFLVGDDGLPIAPKAPTRVFM
jgi:hypothetical protein